MKAFYIILALGLFLLLLSMERVQKERTGRQAAALMEDIEFKKARNQYLRYKTGIYVSPDKIIPAARERGLVMTPAENIILLEEET
jgi:hypothetical protein